MTDAPPCRIVRISRNVASLEIGVAFYVERLGFARSGPPFLMEPTLAGALGLGSHHVRVQRLHLAEQALELVEVGPSARHYPRRHTSADLIFQHIAIRTDDIHAAFERLHRSDVDAMRPVAISADPGHGARPVQLPKSSGGALAFKFRDPDGHPVELLQLDSNTPGCTTRRAMGRGGIDHTAISVSSTAVSCAFYETVLGLVVGTHQTNFGTEQGYLDALAAPVVEVTALLSTPDISPHLELLAYRHLEPIKPFSNVQSQDIAADKTVIACENIDALATRLGIASNVVRLASGEAILLFRDPDGHCLLAVESPGASTYQKR